MERPEYLKQGETARLFPVLSTTSKEGRTTSILLACLVRVNELQRELFKSVDQKIGKRSVVHAFTETVFKGQEKSNNDRPDGLLIHSNSGSEWRALIEAKIGAAKLEEDQIEKYRAIAKEHKLDCVITISNDFATNPQTHPLTVVRNSRSKIPVFHWSWMYILTTTHLLLSNDAVEDVDQRLILEELRRFLSHESAGVKSFERMPTDWTELNKQVAAGMPISVKSNEAFAVVNAWHQETRDLSLILCRQTGSFVNEKLSRKHTTEPKERIKDDLKLLQDTNQLLAVLDVPNAAAAIEIVADVSRRSINVGMTIKAPEDRKSSQARVNWLLKQIKSQNVDDLWVKCNWPSRSDATLFKFSELQEEPSIVQKDKRNLQVSSFHIYFSKKIGARFAQQTNFIVDLETLVPEFYREIGQNLNVWRKPAPRIKEESAITVEDILKRAQEQDTT